MKILILFIYSKNEHYDKMLEVQRTYCNKHENVRSFFVTYRKMQQNDIELEDDIVYVKGEETYLGITRKTISAMEYLLNQFQDVDFVVRSNMSTVINIPVLKSFCSTLPKTDVYTSGIMNDLQWLDPKSGIVDKSLWGTKYASGTSIILSKDLAIKLVKDKDRIRHDIVDDVSIGVFMKDVHKNDAPIAKFIFVTSGIEARTIDTDAVFYRTRTDGCRVSDIRNMQTICDLLYKPEGFAVYTKTASPNFDKGIMILGLLFIGYGSFILGRNMCKKKLFAKST